MFNRLRILWQCFTVWHVEPTSLENAQVILSQAGGNVDEETPGKINEHLATIIRELHEQFQLPLILQGEVVPCLRDLRILAHTAQQQEIDRYLSTRDVCLFQKKVCEEHGFQRVIVVAFGHHLWRAVRATERVGLEVLIPPGIQNVYEPKSSQWFCRSSFLFVPREIMVRLYFLMRGWL